MNQLYRCRVVDESGKAHWFERFASSERMLAHALRGEGFRLIEAVPVASRAPRRLSMSQALEFTESLNLLFSQNLSLKDAIHVLATIKGNTALRALIQSVEDRLNKGDSLAQALEDYRSSFPPLYLGLIRVGELSGTLKTALPQLTKYLENKKRLREKILSSLMYPSLIIIILVVGMLLLSIFILPKFLVIAQALEGPGAGASHLQDNLRALRIAFESLFLVVPASIVAWRLARRRPKLRRIIDATLFTRPPLNRLFAGIEMQNLCFALGALLESGYTVDSALEECKRVTGNKALEEALESVRLKTKKGARLSASFRGTGIMPEAFCSWIEVGEEAHDLRGVFRYLQEFYEHSFEKTTQAIMSLVEPGLIIIVGCVILVVILQVIGPIFRLMGGTA